MEAAVAEVGQIGRIGVIGGDELPPVLTVPWRDELTRDQAPVFRALIRKLLDHRRDLTVDLRECPYLSEEGVGELLWAKHQCDRLGVRFRVSGASGQPRKSLETKQLTGLFC